MADPRAILVTGAGATGLSAALALSGAGFDVIVAGAAATAPRSRTVALLEGSIRFYRAVSVWDRLAPDAAAMTKMRIVDATGSLFTVAPVEFDATEIGFAAFGANIESSILIGHLAAAARQRPGVRWIEAPVVHLEFQEAHAEATFADGRRLGVGLVVAGDGARSPARDAARIAVETWVYPQAALTAILAHARPHGSVSTEFYTRSGPFTLVPLPATSEAAHRSSLVWLQRPRAAERLENLPAAEFEREAEHRAYSILGAFRLEQGVSSSPMHGLRARRLVAPRLALVGEAAHVFPPIGAQGLNLGLRDIAHLADCVARHSHDPGGEAALRAYESSRVVDIDSRTRGVDALNRSLLADWLPADFLRGLGLVGLSALPPLRRALMRQGIMPTVNVPTLMRSCEA